MSLPKYLDDFNDEISKYLSICTLSKEEKNLIKILNSLLEYFHWSIYKLKNKNADANEINPINAEISKVKYEILTFLEKSYTKQQFFILDVNCFDDSIEFISILIINFFYYFSNNELQTGILNIYFYLFHLIYYILHIIVKCVTPDIINNRIIKFYLYHIIHFFAYDKKCPEFNFFFYEGAFKHLSKNFNISVEFLFSLDNKFLKVLKGNDVISIVTKYKKDKSGKKTNIVTELDFIGKFPKVICEVSKILNDQYDNEEKIQSEENFDNNLLIELCENYRKKIEKVINFLKQNSI